MKGLTLISIFWTVAFGLLLLLGCYSILTEVGFKPTDAPFGYYTRR